MSGFRPRVVLVLIAWLNASEPVIGQYTQLGAAPTLLVDGTYGCVCGCTVALSIIGAGGGAGFTSQTRAGVRLCQAAGGAGDVVSAALHLSVGGRFSTSVGGAPINPSPTPTDYSGGGGGASAVYSGATPWVVAGGGGGGGVGDPPGTGSCSSGGDGGGAGVLALGLEARGNTALNAGSSAGGGGGGSLGCTTSTTGGDGKGAVGLVYLNGGLSAGWGGVSASGGNGYQSGADEEGGGGGGGYRGGCGGSYSSPANEGAGGGGGSSYCALVASLTSCSAGTPHALYGGSGQSGAIIVRSITLFSCSPTPSASPVRSPSRLQSPSAASTFTNSAQVTRSPSFFASFTPTSTLSTLPSLFYTASIRASTSAPPSMLPTASLLDDNTPSADSSFPTTPTSFPSFSFAPLPDGSLCTTSASCASHHCRLGACCNPSAIAVNCGGCSFQSGSCILRAPGEFCSTRFDCASDLCLGGCCCSPLAPSGCTACVCWSPLPLPPASIGSCVLAPSPALVPCNATSSESVASSTIAAELVTFPASAGLSGRPLLVLSSSSPLNLHGVDIVIATPEACAAWSAASGFVCTFSKSYAISGALYYFAGTAASLNMEASGVCPF